MVVATVGNKVRADELLRQAFPHLFEKLTKEQVVEFCELAQMYSDQRDPEILETMVELLIPETLGVIVLDAAVPQDSAKLLDEYQEQIGQRIRDERVLRNWSQEELAERAGLRQSHVSRLEQGKHTPSDLTIQKIAKALGMRPIDLDPGHE